MQLKLVGICGVLGPFSRRCAPIFGRPRLQPCAASVGRHLPESGTGFNDSAGLALGLLRTRADLQQRSPIDGAV